MKSEPNRAVKCPACGTLTPRIFLAGKQALCINSKCNIMKFTVQDYEAKATKNGRVTKRNSKSYNNTKRK